MMRGQENIVMLTKSRKLARYVKNKSLDAFYCKSGGDSLLAPIAQLAITIMKVELARISHCDVCGAGREHNDRSPTDVAKYQYALVNCKNCEVELCWICHYCFTGKRFASEPELADRYDYFINECDCNETNWVMIMIGTDVVRKEYTAHINRKVPFE